MPVTTEDLKATNVRWDLTPFFPGLPSEAYEAALGTFTQNTDVFVRDWKSKIETAKGALSPNELHLCLANYDQLIGEISKIRSFVYCLASADTQNELYQKERGRITEVGSHFRQKTLFLDIQLKQVPDSVFQTWMDSSELAEWQYHLKTLRQERPFTLTEPEESWITIKSLTGKNAWVQFYDQITSRFQYSIPEVSDKPLNESEVRSLRYSEKREIRELATRALAKNYEENSPVLTPIYENIFKDHLVESQKRGYQSPISPVNLGNDLSDEVVETLLRATEKHYPLAQRYYNLKKKVLGLSDLKSWDLYAPLTKNTHQVSWPEAKTLVTEAYRYFDPEFGSLTEQFFEKNYIEAENRPGKRGGAYCITFGSKENPRVFMTYTASPRDISTIAHEFGHAIHFFYSKNQRNLNGHAVLPLAETASVFGEMLLTKHYLAKVDSKEQKRQLLAQKIEDMTATVFSQNVYIRFEQKAYQALSEKKLGTEDFSAIWSEEFKKFYGGTIDYYEGSRFIWQAIPHFIHTRFYCYSYTFGELLSLSLYGLYEQNPTEEFKTKFKALLTNGCTNSPQALLSPFGIDLSQESFWNQGFKTMESFIDEFEKTL